MSASANQNAASDSPPLSAWTPLRHPVFRVLWATWLTANVCMWMNDVAAAWLMTTLTSTPVMIALVQAASTVPVFLLGVPSGALADIVDRRRYLIATQCWLMTTATVLAFSTFAGLHSPALLLILTLANGIGLAMRWPVYAAIVPEVVPRHELPIALALNGVAMNVSRIVGPSIAGFIIASYGSSHVFILNAAMSVAAAATLVCWRYEPARRTLPRERFFSAIRAGVQYVRHSPPMLAVLARAAIFFSMSIALNALLPLVAKDLLAGDARTFTLLLASMGAGAIVAATLLPRMRRRWVRDELVNRATLLHAAMAFSVAFAPNRYLAALFMVGAGFAWISAANSLSVTAQMSLPDWVRARGMAFYQMALMGGSALGAAFWGQVATVANVRTALVLGACGSVAGVALLRRIRLGGGTEEQRPATRSWEEQPHGMQVEAEQGPVLVTIEYRIDPARAEEFAEVMRESRRARLRNGALSWELFQDAAHPGCYIEHFIDDSWAQHMRQHERISAADAVLQQKKREFQLEGDPPVTRHFVARPLPKAGMLRDTRAEMQAEAR